MLSLPRSLVRSFLCAHAHTSKHHAAAGTVKRTVPYKELCIFFINWGMVTDIKLKDYMLYKYKERIKKKGLVILNVIDNIK